MYQRVVWTLLLVFMASAPLTSISAQEAPERRFEVLTTKVGKQYLVLGFQSSLWFGSGTIHELGPDGVKGARLGEFSDKAFGIGPLSIGLSHVVTDSVIFEVRLGAGVHVFENDRLVSQALSAEGGRHFGRALEAEIIGRWQGPSGLTLGLGANIASLRLPDANSTLMRVSPRLGWFFWEDDWAGYSLVEVGYQFPIINGLIPDIDGVDRDPPKDSTWHVLNVAYTFGF